MKKFKSFFEDFEMLKETPILFITFIIFFFGLLMYLSIFALIFIWPLEKVSMYADIFNKSAIGLGALLAGMGALSFLGRIISKEFEIIRKKDYQKLYPINEFPQRFDIIDHKSRKKRFYLRDKKEKIVRHIEDGYTYFQLGWSKFDIETLEDNDFEKYSKGESISILDRSKK